MGGNTVVASWWWTGRNWFDEDGIRIMDLHIVDIKGGIRYDVGEFSGIRNVCISGTNYHLRESIQGSLGWPWLRTVYRSYSQVHDVVVFHIEDSTDVAKLPSGR